MSRNGDEIKAKSDETLWLGSHQFNPVEAELFTHYGATVALRSQSLEVLKCLAEKCGQTVSKTELIEKVWGDRFVTDDSLVQCIADIRRAIDDRDRSVVETIPRRGYRLLPGNPVATDEPPPLEFAGSRSIAVLPFTSLRRDEDQVFFATGISEDLITRLSMVRGLNVIAPITDYSFDGNAMRLEDSNIEPDAEFVLKGSLRRSGDRIRVTVNLLQKLSASVVFSRRYDREIKDIFEIQDDIVSELVSETMVALTEGDAARLELRRTRSVQAWEYFHRGWLEHIKYTADGNRAARRFYEKALEEDPDYFDALVADGWAQWMEVKSSFADDLDGALRHTRSYVDDLLKRLPNNSDLLNLDATLLVQEGKHDEALEKADAAYAGPPSLMYGRATTAWVYLYSGELEQARDIFQEAANGAPFVSDDTLHYFAHCLSLLGEHDRAIEMAKTYRQRVPKTVWGFTLLAMAQALAGNLDEAKRTVAALRVAHPRFDLATFRNHEPYRDKAMLENIVGLLRDAGIPD